MPNSDPDVAIIGAGPAGSLAALLVARAGLSVTIIEQSHFPREKVCGECLSALGLNVLDRAGLTETIAAAGATRLTACDIYPPAGRPLHIKLPRPMAGLSRASLDGLLLSEAARRGVEISQPARVEALLLLPPPRGEGRGGAALWNEAHSPAIGLGVIAHPHPNPPPEGEGTGRLRLTVRDLVTNAVTPINANCVILADGKSALLGNPKPPSTGDLGIKAHFISKNLAADNSIALYGFADCYGGLAAIEGNRWNFATSVPAQRLKACRGDLDALLLQLRAENAAFDKRLHQMQRTGDWCASPLPRFGVVRRWPAGVVPVGNAAAAIEPIGGEGMGLALRSAELAAEEIVAAHREARDVDATKLRRAFETLWRTRRLGCRGAAIALSSPKLARACGAVAVVIPNLARAAMRLMGK